MEQQALALLDRYPDGMSVADLGKALNLNPNELADVIYPVMDQVDLSQVGTIVLH